MEHKRNEGYVIVSKEDLEYIKEAMRIHKLKTDIQHNEKGQKDKQRFTKQYTKNKDRQTLTALKTAGELRCSGRVGSSCTIIGNSRVTLITNPQTR